jgi:hypothetical protein
MCALVGCGSRLKDKSSNEMCTSIVQPVYELTDVYTNDREQDTTQFEISLRKRATLLA